MSRLVPVITSMFSVGRFCLHTWLRGMIYKFWDLWMCLQLCCKLKVVRLRFLLLHHYIVFWSLNVSCSVELDESMLDGLGILPQRKQHKKLLLVCYILPFWCLSVPKHLTVDLFHFAFWVGQITLMPKLYTWFS